MKKTNSLKVITALCVGCSFLAMIFLLYWSSKVNVGRLDGNYTGKRTLHLLAFKNSQLIAVSISVKFIDIHCDKISNNTFCAWFPSAEVCNKSSFAFPAK